SPDTGLEPWITGGTPDSTRFIADVDPGTNGSRIGEPATVVMSGVAYFMASNQSYPPGTNEELWRSDGTAAGTYQVVDLNPAGGSAPQEKGIAGGTLFFSATPGTSGPVLYATDGTAAGTRLLSSTAGSPHGFTALGSVMLFGATDANGTTLWRSDGTPA